LGSKVKDLLDLDPIILHEQPNEFISLRHLMQ